MSKISEELNDIFNIPRDGSNIKVEDDSQEGAYASVVNSNSNVPFSEKASIVSQKIKEVARPQEEVEYVSQPPSVVTEEKVAVKPAEVKVETPKPLVQTSMEASKHVNTEPEAILTKALSVKDNERSENISMDTKPAIRDTDGDESEDSDDASEVRPEHEHTEGSDEHASSKVISCTENADGWLVESPAPKYNQFYLEKSWMIPRLLRGGKVPVDKYRKELSEAYVDTKVEMYDLELIAQKMTEIRGWQTRVLQIRGHVLAQFHAWKRAVELFHGVLARAEYAKPAICQQGLIYNHMRDMEMYLADLQYLHDFSKEMLGNLMSHFDSLSRQVTLSMPLKGVERTEYAVETPMPPALNLPDSPKPVAKKSNLNGFDKLENNVEQKDSSPKKPNNISMSKAPSNAPKKALDWDNID